MASQDYYDLLGVPPSASATEIQQAFRRLALRYHPDVDSSPDAVARFQEINAAYQVLGDPARRAAYDASLAPEPASPVERCRAGRVNIRRSYFQRRVRAAANPRSTWNYYDVLGVPHNASLETILRAYQRLYREFYSGREQDPETASILREIVEAREALGDPEKRLAYDRLPACRQPPGRPAAPRPASARVCLVARLLAPLTALSALARRAGAVLKRKTAR